jgi:hypothetical protein
MILFSDIPVGKLILKGTNTCDEFEYDDICDIITRYIKFPEWYCEVRGFGWMGRNGHKVFKSATGRSMLREVLPNTECSFKIYRYGRNGFAINNAHHDKPTGGEWYYIVPMTKKIAKGIA